MHLEFQIESVYILHLDIEHNGHTHGTVVRLPDEVEGHFNHTDGLLALLEGMGGRRWWNAHREQIERQFAAGDPPGATP